MILNKISLRTWYLAAAVSCGALLAFALFKQYQDFLDPCPLCVIQRVAYLWIGIFALLAAIHHPARKGQVIYCWLIALGAVFGTAVAGRHTWLQHLPSELVPECGPGLNYMLENFPLSETLSAVFLGSGSCAEVKWSFLGLSMPEWNLAWFLGLGILTLWFTFRRPFR
jgi:disulfide bond formation protein DsbB